MLNLVFRLFVGSSFFSYVFGSNAVRTEFYRVDLINVKCVLSYDLVSYARQMLSSCYASVLCRSVDFGIFS